MRALVTGATGFIGSYLIEYLLKNKIDVGIVKRKKSDTWRIKDFLNNITIIESDMGKINDAEGLIINFAPDTIFHLAWTGVTNKYRNDINQIDKNIYGSIKLVKIGKKAGCKTFIGLGSQAEYGPLQKIINENMPTNPTTLYGVSKLCCGLLTRSLCSHFNIRFAWIRLFSSYGPKADSSWMIPYLILSLLRNEKPSLTKGEQRWDYIYVEDVAEAIYTIAKTPEAEGVFNLGSGKTHTIKSIVESIRDLINSNAPLGIGEVPYREDQIMHLQADISRIKSITNWSPKVMLSDGLRRTVCWYKLE